VLYGTAAIPGFANAGSTGRHQMSCFAIDLDFSFIGKPMVLFSIGLWVKVYFLAQTDSPDESSPAFCGCVAKFIVLG
jgi:hypothetical protein